MRKRTETRKASREAEKIRDAREKLLRLDVGGAPDLPIELQSASQIEPHALGQTCIHCGGSYQLEAHDALVHRGRGVRRVALGCRQCGASRVTYFALPMLQ